MSEFEEYEDLLWLPDSGLASSSDLRQFLSLTGDCSPGPVLSNFSIIDSEVLNGARTGCSSSLMMGGNEFSELSDEFNLVQELDWPELLTDHEEHGPDNHVIIPDAHQSICSAMESVFNSETNLVEISGVSRSASVRCRWPNFVRLICACNRLSRAAAASLRAKVPNALKGVMKKKDKYVCEMRIMMKMQKEKKKLIPKVWLGTYKTEDQAARALDVGKFFFNSKETKSFYSPNSETILSMLSHLLAQPLEELVKNVKKLAKHYGENGSLQNFVL